jgi:hypothetical protein
MRFLLGLSLVVTLYAQDAGGGVVGRWRSAETSKGGIGSIIQLMKGGVIEYSPGAVVELKYRIEGDELILPPAAAKGPEVRQKLQFVSDKQMRMISDTDPVVNLSRHGKPPDPANPILGEWTTLRELNGQRMIAHYLFYPGGKAMLLLPFLTKAGRYTVEGNKMKIDIPTLGASEGSFRRQGNVLSLPLGKSGKVKYLAY